MDTFAQRQDALIETLELLPTAEERLMWLTQPQEGGEFHLAPEQRHAELLVPGCVSAVWLQGRLEEGLCHFRCAADSALVAGLVLAQARLAQGLEPEALAGADFTWIARSGLDRSLSHTRQQGLAAVASRLREFARSQE